MRPKMRNQDSWFLFLPKCLSSNFLPMSPEAFWFCSGQTGWLGLTPVVTWQRVQEMCPQLTGLWWQGGGGKRIVTKLRNDWCDSVIFFLVNNDHFARYTYT